MSEITVEEESIAKALEALQDINSTIAKGHSSRGTSTTNVETMRDGGAGAGSDAGSTQVYHTPANSDPGTWAGTGQRRSPEDGTTDGIDEDGTDYNAGSAEMVKSVLEKAAAGLPLDPIEKAVLAEFAKGGGMFTNFAGTGKKGGYENDKDKEKVEKAKAKDDDDDDDKEDYKFGKSLAESASEHEDVASGLEVSSFLHGWTEVQSDTLKGVETRLTKALSESHSEQREFNVELAKSISGLAEVLTIEAQRIEQLESTPARAPKSAVSASAVEKSFGAGGVVAPEGEDLTKSQVLDTMVDMVEHSELSATEVIKFESSGQLTPDLDSKVRAYRTGRS